MKPFVSILADKAAPGINKQVKNIDIGIVPLFSMRCQ